MNNTIHIYKKTYNHITPESGGKPYRWRRLGQSQKVSVPSATDHEGEGWKGRELVWRLLDQQ